MTDATSPPFPPETVSVTCPQCGHVYGASAYRVVDSQDEPARRALLSGSLNIAQCPRCSAATRVATPVLFHDKEHEAALVWLPQGLEVSRDEQEREIGRLTNQVLDRLPPEERKMYLLQPKTYLAEQSFLDAVLEASGVSREELERARERARVVERLMAAGSDEEMQTILEDRGDTSDYELLLLVRALQEGAQDAGDAARARALAGLQQRLVGLLGEPQLSLDDLLKQLQAALDRDRLDEVVSYLRPALDYSFFANLTGRIEGSDADTAQALTRLRTELLEAVDRIDASAKEEVEAAVDLLKWLLQAGNPKPALESRKEEIGPAFFLVLQANVQAAREHGEASVADRLEAIYDAAIELVEADMEPAERLVNQLAGAEGATERSSLLDEAAANGLVDPELLEALRATAESARSGGADDVAGHLEAAADEVERRLRPSTSAP